ncbi:MAG: hypothetical protein IPI49_04955 [Myxococcales bacterium]|nr:hypothetical protein [Myxococcales bacterium]
MADADRDRLEPLRQLRHVDQQVSAGQLGEAQAESVRRQRALAQARQALAEAQARLERAQARLLSLSAEGTTAERLALAAAYSARCRTLLRQAERDRDGAAAQEAVGELALGQAQDGLAQARARRAVLERYRDRTRHEARRLREQRAE